MAQKRVTFVDSSKVTSSYQRFNKTDFLLSYWIRLYRLNNKHKLPLDLVKLFQLLLFHMDEYYFSDKLKVLKYFPKNRVIIRYNLPPKLSVIEVVVSNKTIHNSFNRKVYLLNVYRAREFGIGLIEYSFKLSMDDDYCSVQDVIGEHNCFLYFGKHSPYEIKHKILYSEDNKDIFQNPMDLYGFNMTRFNKYCINVENNILGLKFNNLCYYEQKLNSNKRYKMIIVFKQDHNVLNFKDDFVVVV